MHDIIHLTPQDDILAIQAEAEAESQEKARQIIDTCIITLGDYIESMGHLWGQYFTDESDDPTGEEWLACKSQFRVLYYGLSELTAKMQACIGECRPSYTDELKTITENALKGMGLKLRIDH